MANEKKLMKLCGEFIEKHDITCPECIYQSDQVIEDAYQFIQDVCDIVGYQVMPGDE